MINKEYIIQALLLNSAKNLRKNTNFIQNLSDIGNREIISKQFLLSQNNLYTKTQQDYHKKQKFIGQTLSGILI